MDNSEYSFLNAAGLTRRGFLALVLVGALLLCHGAFGVLHKFSDPEQSAIYDFSFIKHTLSHEKGNMEKHSQDHNGKFLVSCEYYATLIVVFLGGVIGLLLSIFRSSQVWCRNVALQVCDRCFSLIGLHLARGPTASLLQVLRL